MVHFFGIFSPPANRQAGEDQQAFFSDTPTKAEADAAVLTGKRPPHGALALPLITIHVFPETKKQETARERETSRNAPPLSTDRR